MSCVKCGYCEHCGRSNQSPLYVQQWPYQLSQGLQVTCQTGASQQAQFQGNQTVGPGLANLQQISQQQQAACGHPQQEKK